MYALRSVSYVLMHTSRNLYFDFLFRYLFYSSIHSSLTLNLILLYYLRRFRQTLRNENNTQYYCYYSILRYNSIITYHICYKCKFVYINLQIQLYGMFMGILETYIKTYFETLRIDMLRFLIKSPNKYIYISRFQQNAFYCLE